MGGLWPLLLAVLAMIIGAILGYYEMRERTRQLRGFARRIGFHFIHKHSIRKDPTLSRMRVFAKGIGRQCMNLIGGIHRGVELVAMDVTRTIVKGATSSKNKESDGTWVTVCTHPLGGSYPDLAVRPYSVLESDVLALFHWDDSEDIQFESEEFNKAFRVGCQDRKFAFDFCHPRMMTLLLDHRDWAVFISSGVLLIHNATVWGEQGYFKAFDLMAEIVGFIPEHVRREYGPKEEEES